jgi:hypothetical protein
MSGPIQTNPLGLLGALSLKNTGKNPPVMNDSLQPVYDIRGDYLASGERFAAQSSVGFGAGDTAANTSNGSSAITPAAGEAWYIHGGIIQFVVPATGTATEIAVTAVRNGSPSAAFQIEQISDTAAASNVIAATVAKVWSVPIRGGFWLKQGEVIQAYITRMIGIAVAGPTVGWTVLYTPVQV